MLISSSIDRKRLSWPIAALLAGAAGGCMPAPHKTAAHDSAPVTAAIAQRQDEPITLGGLGHVQGLNTAPARAQTGGQIQKILFVEGGEVRAGDPIAQIDPRPLQATVAQDQANLGRDQAALAKAIEDLARNTPLLSAGLASAQQIDADKSQAAQFRAAVAGDEAVITRDRLQLDYTNIRAPISGVAGLRMVDAGNLVTPNDPQGIVTIVQIEPIAVLFTLPQADLPTVRAAMAEAGKSGLSVDALDQTSSAKLDGGRLELVNNQVDAASGTFVLKAIFPNAAKRLWPGEFVNVRLTLGVQRQAVTTPATALQRGPSGAYVWVIDGAGQAHTRPVTPGAVLGDRSIIQSGLAGGSASGVLVCRSGALIAPIPDDRRQPSSRGSPPSVRGRRAAARTPAHRAPGRTGRW